jgi:hypothetical protein
LSYILWVLKELLALGDELTNDCPPCLQLAEGLLLSLNQLLHIFNAAGSNVTGGAEHDAVKELNVRLQIITVGVALPVEIDLDLSLENSGDQLFVLLDESIQFGNLQKKNTFFYK